jgi:hypothetical protein
VPLSTSTSLGNRALGLEKCWDFFLVDKSGPPQILSLTATPTYAVEVVQAN